MLDTFKGLSKGNSRQFEVLEALKVETLNLFIPSRVLMVKKADKTLGFVLITEL